LQDNSCVEASLERRSNREKFGENSECFGVEHGYYADSKPCRRQWAEAFEKLKSLVATGDDKTNRNKATLDLELTSGGTAVLEKFHMVEAASRWR